MQDSGAKSVDSVFQSFHLCPGETVIDLFHCPDDRHPESGSNHNKPSLSSTDTDETVENEDNDSSQSNNKGNGNKASKAGDVFSTRVKSRLRQTRANGRNLFPGCVVVTSK